MPTAPGSEIVPPVLAWFDLAGRTLPWRTSSHDAWGVLVSEVMLQQTPVARVLPVWTDWMRRWPTPAALAHASQADVIRAWGRMGYPSRAVRLRECALMVERDHGGVIPSEEDALVRLPGVGPYTAAAVAAFAFGVRTTVLETNVRRVIGRAINGDALPATHITVAERRRAADLVPEDGIDAVRWNIAAMELGALVCTARSPQCGECPIASECAWFAAGRPGLGEARSRTQSWIGSDRHLRGRIMAILRDSNKPVNVSGQTALSDVEPGQVDRAIDALVRDGLVRRVSSRRGTYSL